MEENKEAREGKEKTRRWRKRVNGEEKGVEGKEKEEEETRGKRKRIWRGRAKKGGGHEEGAMCTADAVLSPIPEHVWI